MSELAGVRRLRACDDVRFCGRCACRRVVWLCAVLMCTVLLCSVPLLVLPGPASADEVSGGITKDTSWTSAQNPWLVTGNVTVKSGATLTIESGVEVLFDDNWYLWTDATTGGTIVVEGAIWDSVVFRAASGLPGESQWKEIGIFDSPGTSFDYCVVMHATTGIKLSDSDSPITHCAVRHCQTGIWCLRASPIIQSSWVTDCSSSGIFCKTRASSPVIHDCNLYDNPAYNIRLMSYGPPMVTIDAKENWWGTADQAEIEASIYDSNDAPGAIYGTVDFAPWLPGTPVEAHTWGYIKALFRH